MSEITSPATGRAIRSGSMLEALIPIGLALVIIATTIGAMLVSLPLGLTTCFALTALVSFTRPADVPVMIVASFLFQNTLIAWVTPHVADDPQMFDTLRGTNFVMLVTAFGMFLAAAFTGRLGYLTPTRRWVLAGLVVLAVVCLYLAIGAVRGEPRDAIVYFRNTLTPLACFLIALIGASLYRVDLRKALSVMAAIAIAYGYCELILTLDFLSLFNGDQYIKLQMTQQIETGYWEERLRETGFVLRGLDDIFITSFFNTPLLQDILPTVWRIAGPNFHPISYAYALAILSVALMFKGRWLLPLLALPLLVIIGSKGAMVLLLVAGAAAVSLRVFGPKLTALAVVGVAAMWILAAITVGMTTGDFHVLGFFAGVREFLGDPLGQGLGIGGNISSTSARVDWDLSQASGASNVPVESAIGVLLYQMGVGALVFIGFLVALAVTSFRLLLRTNDNDFLAAFVLIVVIGANAVLQEEAFYSPLALGFALVLAGVALGTAIREQRVAIS
jgi:hypothetical protein